MKLLAFRALCLCVLSFCLPATFAAGVQWDPDGSVHPANRLNPHFRNLMVTSNTTLRQLTVTNTITAGGLVVTAPTFSSFVNAPHNHQDAAGGAQLNASSVFSAGTIPTARLGSGVADSTTFLRGDSTWQVPAGSGSSIFFDGVSVSNPDFDSNTNVVWQINGTNVTAYVTNVTSGQILGGTGFGDVVRAGSPTISDPIFTSTIFFEGLVFTIEGAIADGNETLFEFGEPTADATYEFDTSRMSTPGSIEVGGALISARSFHTGTSVTIPWTKDEHELHLSADTTFSFSSVPTDTNYVSGPRIWVVGDGASVFTNSANSIVWHPIYPGIVPSGTNEIFFDFAGGLIHGYLGWKTVSTNGLVAQNDNGYYGVAFSGNSDESLRGDGTWATSGGYLWETRVWDVGPTNSAAETTIVTNNFAAGFFNTNTIIRVNLENGAWANGSGGNATWTVKLYFNGEVLNENTIANANSAGTVGYVYLAIVAANRGSLSIQDYSYRSIGSTRTTPAGTIDGGEMGSTGVAWQGGVIGDSTVDTSGAVNFGVTVTCSTATATSFMRFRTVHAYAE